MMQMIMRPQPFDLRQWHVALQKLPTLLAGTSVGSTKSGASVAHRLVLASPVYTKWDCLANCSCGSYCGAALAAQTLVKFMATDKALSSCSKSVTIIGQAFEHVTAFADVLKVSDYLWMLKKNIHPESQG